MHCMPITDSQKIKEITQKGFPCALGAQMEQSTANNITIIVYHNFQYIYTFHSFS